MKWHPHVLFIFTVLFLVYINLKWHRGWWTSYSHLRSHTLYYSFLLPPLLSTLSKCIFLLFCQPFFTLALLPLYLHPLYFCFQPFCALYPQWWQINIGSLLFRQDFLDNMEIVNLIEKGQTRRSEGITLLIETPTNRGRQAVKAWNWKY